MAVVDAPTLRGLDALERPSVVKRRRWWPIIWPKLAAVGLALGLWQLVVWTGWRPEFVLPSPLTVLARFGADLVSGELLRAMAVTLRRAVTGYLLAVAIGTLVGLAVARSKVLRSAVGSLITGLQTMPSIAWFPLAILLFKLDEGAILFVVVLGAAPSIANGVISGVDHVPPLLLNAGRAMGARRLAFYRHVLMPAALPGFVAGLKQGWAFAWRSLMAGELLVIIANQPSLGVRLQFARELADAQGLIAAMLVILVIGIVVDSLGFGLVERSIRRNRGLIEEAS
jgi:NitT/TauT family transport system permease protein